MGMKAKAPHYGSQCSAGGSNASAGYKLTEAGVIPSDWDATRLGDLASIINGATPSTRVKRYWDGDIPWCTPTDITAVPGKYLTEAERCITEVGLSRCGASILQVGALLLCSRATVGELKIAAVPVCTNQGFKSLVCWDGVSNEFLYYLLLTLKPRLLERAIGSTFLEIGKRDISGIQIGLPPLPEQRAIAKALSDVDGLILALEKLIAKKRAIKQASMQQLLTGKTRLPGFTGKWETLPLGDVAEVKTGPFGSALHERDYVFDGTPIITVEHLGERGVVHTNLPMVCDADRERLRVYRLTEGDIVFSRVGSIDRNALIRVDEEGWLFSGRLLRIRPVGECIFSPYLSYHFHGEQFRSRVREVAVGQTMASLNTRILQGVQVVLPELSEQEAIATVLSDLDAEIAAIERRRDKTKQIKQSMMQQLLTGRTRLVKPQAPKLQIEADIKSSKPHSWAFNEAVVISTLARHFGKEEFPLGRKRYTKLSYLLHRYTERQADGYLKKAAGPYNPKTKYGGPERIALENSYIREYKHGKYRGFIAADGIAQAEGYFEKWYGPDAIPWLEQFRFNKNDDLEVLTTVDMAAEELRRVGKNVDVPGVKAVICSHPEWKAKLDREVFSDGNIAKAIETSRRLFP